ncbi:unnamed protein product, partial [Closterium sp. Naga37s-1]
MSQGTQPGEDAFSILVATDNHLGFMEKDDVRRHDSFTAFEEICKLAQSLQVDFLLLGGDLFHDNKPSRATLVRTIDILRRYCLSDNPVRFQVVSDQTLNFPNSFGHVNYEDEHYNVGMPVFTVHGNHDDPAGIDNLSAVDILSSCNLVNYFGKSNMPEHDAAHITLHPVLLRKGANRIALYGLGYMRDERLKMIMDNPQGLQWIRPDEPGTSEDDWFNILVVHQNRAVRMTGAKKVVTVDESKFASFLDLVLWGHEHECRIEPEAPVGANYYISQPGSSVVTQLAEGEAKPKHVLHLLVQGNKFESRNIALTTPRPFEYAEVTLRNAQGVNARDPEELALFLSATVQRMIAKAESSYRERRAAQLPEGLLDGGGSGGREGSREGPVDYSGFSTINSQRFGQQFVGKVANPHDMLMFFKAPTRKPSTTVLEVGEERVVQPDELNQSNIEQLLRDSNVKLEVLSLGGLAEALHGFVGRDETHAFSSFLSSSLSDTQAWLVKEQEGAGLRDDEDILRLVEQRVLQVGKGGRYWLHVMNACPLLWAAATKCFLLWLQGSMKHTPFSLASPAAIPPTAAPSIRLSVPQPPPCSACAVCSWQDMEKRGGAAAPGDGSGDAGAAQPMPDVSSVVAWSSPCPAPWPFQSADSIPSHAMPRCAPCNLPTSPPPPLPTFSALPISPPRPSPTLSPASTLQRGSMDAPKQGEEREGGDEGDEWEADEWEQGSKGRGGKGRGGRGRGRGSAKAAAGDGVSLRGGRGGRGRGRSSSGGAGGRGMKQATFDSMGLRGRSTITATPAGGRAAASVGSTKVPVEEEEEIEDDDLTGQGMMGAPRGAADVDMDKEEEGPEEEAVGLGSRASAARAASQRRSTAAASPMSQREGRGRGRGAGAAAAAAAGGGGRGRGRGRAVVGGWSSLGVSGVGTAGVSVQSDGEESDEEEHVRHGGIEEEDDEEEDGEEEEEEQRARAKRARRGVGGVVGGFSFTPSQVSVEDAMCDPRL